MRIRGTRCRTLAVPRGVDANELTASSPTTFTHWPGALPVILMLSTFIGGCAGSTSGGMKVVRWLLLWKQGQREVVQLVHPSAEVPVKLGAESDRSRASSMRCGASSRVYIVGVQRAHGAR